MYDPIAYVYEADHRCEACALARFGRDEHGDIDGIDEEGNRVGIVAPWDEWQVFDGEPEALTCGTCGDVLAVYVPDDYVYPFDEAEARRVASEWHGGQTSALYAFSSTATVTPELLSEIGEAVEIASRGDYDERDRVELEQLHEYVAANPPQVEALFTA